jgi:hypothetical protein
MLAYGQTDRGLHLSPAQLSMRTLCRSFAAERITKVISSLLPEVFATGHGDEAGSLLTGAVLDFRSSRRSVLSGGGQGG